MTDWVQFCDIAEIKKTMSTALLVFSVKTKLISMVMLITHRNTDLRRRGSHKICILSNGKGVS